ncbi:hypothetical protein [Pseudomonas sp. TMP25]|uniref:hypothetical protein n=1 Tax=Pseudomonas sp. TMP25 TaxID=3136561 RepID=UPI003101961A
MDDGISSQRSIHRKLFGAKFCQVICTCWKKQRTNLMTNVTIDREAHWFSLVMNAAAEIEQAAIGITDDPEAKRVAKSGADHYRKRANEAWQNRAKFAQPAPEVEPVEVVTHLQLYTHLRAWKPKSRKEMDAKNAAVALLIGSSHDPAQ